MTLAPGFRVPEFHLPATTGRLTLPGLLGRPFLLSFFSLAFTPT